MAVFTARRIADDACAGGVVLFKGQAGQAADDGLQLIVIGRAVGGDGNQRVQRAVGLGQVAYPCTALGGQRLESQRLPGRMGIALDQNALPTLDRRGRGLVAGVEPSPAAAAEGVVDVEAELGKGPVGDGLDHAGQAGFGSGVELALADAGVLEAVVARLPGLRAVEDNDADVADIAEVVEAAGEDIGVDGT